MLKSQILLNSLLSLLKFHCRKTYLFFIKILLSEIYLQLQNILMDKSTALLQR